MIVGRYAGDKIPIGIMILNLSLENRQFFDCIGPCFEKLQELNIKIFKEWFPLNNEFELRGDGNIEWYDSVNGEKIDPDYHTQNWIPIKAFNKQLDH